MKDVAAARMEPVRLVWVPPLVLLFTPWVPVLDFRELAAVRAVLAKLKISVLRQPELRPSENGPSTWWREREECFLNESYI